LPPSPFPRTRARKLTKTNKPQDYFYLITPNIWALSTKYKDYEAPFYGLNDEIPILLTIILGLQHALTMIDSIISPPLAIVGGAFNFDAQITQYLVSAAFITTGIATALQVTRVHITKTPFYIGTGLLSSVQLSICFLLLSTTRQCDTRMELVPHQLMAHDFPVPMHGVRFSDQCCVLSGQIAMSMLPPKKLNKIFPKIVTGSLLLLVGVYLISNGMQNWCGSSNCNDGTVFYELCPNVAAPKPLPW